MSEQVIDLRSMWAILRRRSGTLAVAATIGAFGGGAAAALLPPDYSSTSIVLLPAVAQGSATASTSHDIDTQVAIVKSAAVLAPAGRAVTPALDAEAVASSVSVEAPTPDVLRITATGPTPSRAEALSKAVANAELDYLRSAANTAIDSAHDALSARQRTLKASLSSVNAEIKNTQQRLSNEPATSSAGGADAAALAELTAQQANLVLQMDQLDGQVAASGTSGSPQGSSAASVIQQASPAVRTPLAFQLAVFGLISVASVVVPTAFTILVRGRRERSMRSRDEIADAVGIAVAASVRSTAPRSVAAWTTLLENYTPGNVESWTLRQLLRLLTPGHPGSLVESTGASADAPHVVVITLAGDQRALAVGPQLASFAASTGLHTYLDPAQGHDSANALWAACSALSDGEQPRPGLFVVDSRSHTEPSGDLVVDLAVVEPARPLLRLQRSGPRVTLLAVSAGSANAEELARVALAADDAGHPIDRIVVVDPDPLDRTTGRLLPAERAQQVALPSLMTGSEVVGEATALKTRRRLR